MTIQQEPETGRAQAATTRTVRATSANSRIGAGTALSSTVTAELPAVRGTAGVPVRRAPGINAVRRQSAPVALRISVWLLALILLVVGVGAVVADVRPDAVSVLRHTVTAGAPASTALVGKTTTKTVTPTFREVSSSATAVIYAVPAPSYDLVIAVSSPTFIEGHSPATSTTWAFARTIPASTKPTTISITGTTTLVMFKTPVSVTIESNGKLLGSVAHPKPGVTYTFEPSSATS